MAEVSGWIWNTNLDKLVEWVATYVDYRWDDLDDDALVGALDSTDADTPDAWFEYPIVGNPPVMLALALNEGSTVLSVRITGAFDTVLAARFDTLIDVFSAS